MIRFFTAPQNISSKTIRLSAEDSKHIRTLRLRPGELFIICDGNSIDYVCKLGERDDNTIAEIVDKHKSHGEPTVKCSVYMAYSKGDRLDYAVQKSVELGVHEIILFESERCIAVPNDIPKKITRLQRISHETAKLCNRGIIPVVTSGGSFNTIINDAASKSDITMLFYENEEDLHIKDILEKSFSPESVSLITGPEGGFESHEVELARTLGIPAVSLGPRILRSETAPVTALTVIMYHTGNL